MIEGYYTRKAETGRMLIIALVDKQILPLLVVYDINDHVRDESCCQQKIMHKSNADSTDGCIACYQIEE